ncbi:MAG: hypothetical protein J6K31_10490 [Parabacteroides sp.]|nr:hypothetical protein [Parabacteroides sp.]
MNALKLISLIILLFLSFETISAERNNIVDKQTVTSSTQTSVQEKPDSEKELGEIIRPYTKKIQNILIKIRIPGVKDPSYYLYISLALLLTFTISMYLEKEHFHSSMITTYCIALATYFCELLYLAHDSDPLWFIYQENFFKTLLWLIVTCVILYRQICTTIELVNTATLRSGCTINGNIGFIGTGIGIAALLVCGIFFTGFVKTLFYIYTGFFLLFIIGLILNSNLKNPTHLLFTILLFSMGCLTTAIYTFKVAIVIIAVVFILFIVYILFNVLFGGGIGNGSSKRFKIRDENGNEKEVKEVTGLLGEKSYQGDDGSEYESTYNIFDSGELERKK